MFYAVLKYLENENTNLNSFSDKAFYFTFEMINKANKLFLRSILLLFLSFFFWISDMNQGYKEKLLFVHQ